MIHVANIVHHLFKWPHIMPKKKDSYYEGTFTVIQNRKRRLFQTGFKMLRDTSSPDEI